MWQGRDIETLNSLELLQAYQTCLSQEQRRNEVSKHDKFNKDKLDQKGQVKTPKMEFPPPNPYFLKIKEALLSEITKRKLQIPE